MKIAAGALLGFVIGIVGIYFFHFQQIVEAGIACARAEAAVQATIALGGKSCLEKTGVVREK